MMIYTCPHCGAILKDDKVEKCQWCGKKVSQKSGVDKTKVLKIGVVIFVAVAVVAAAITMMVLV